MLTQPMKINIGPLPEATQHNWAATLRKAKPAAVATTSLAPIQTNQPMNTPSTLSHISPKHPTEHSNYCAICTPLGNICLQEFPISLDWDDDEEEGKEDLNRGVEQDKMVKRKSL